MIQARTNAFWVRAKMGLALLIGVFFTAPLFAQQQSMPDVTRWRKKVVFEDPYIQHPIKPIALPPHPDDTIPAEKKEPGKVIYDIPPLVDSILAREAALPDEVSGFRVHLFAGNSEKAGNIRYDFLELYPETEVYILYEAPFFKVRVGNFMNRQQADKFCRELKEHFPSAFVVPDMIQPRNTK